MIKYLLSMYSPRYPQVLTYMLQSCEYQAGAYVKWLNRTRNFGTVIQRRVLERTHAAKLLLRLLRFGMAIQILLGLLLIILGIRHTIVGGIYFGLAIIVCYPLVWAYGVVVPLLLGRWFVILPKERQLIAKSEKIFAAHPGQKIAVAGSYGKTTMKELLLTVLSEGKKVAATPANRNVAISHAYFANKLTGHEDIVIIEYGEGQPGDVIRFAKTTHPTQAVITGLAPAHLDHYKSVDAAGNDIFSVADYLDGKNVYVDDASPSIAPFIKSSYQVFNEHGALGWKVKNAAISLEGTEAT
jgi:hypothetical protein